LTVSRSFLSLHHSRKFLTSMHDCTCATINWGWIESGSTLFALKNRITARASHLAEKWNGSSILNCHSVYKNASTETTIMLKNR
jgi:hypothetical protein